MSHNNHKPLQQQKQQENTQLQPIEAELSQMALQECKRQDHQQPAALMQTELLTALQQQHYANTQKMPTNKGDSAVKHSITVNTCS